jgi:hypothetical protein
VAEQQPLQIRGRAIEWGEAEIERMGNLSLEDVVEAALFWHENAPRGMKGLLDAKSAATEYPHTSL